MNHEFTAIFNSNLPSASSAQAVRAGDWVCLMCQNLNYSFRHQCNRCHMQTKANNFYQQMLLLQQEGQQTQQTINIQQQQVEQFQNQNHLQTQTTIRMQNQQQKSQQNHCWIPLQSQSHSQPKYQAKQLQLNTQFAIPNNLLSVDKENIDPQMPTYVPKTQNFQEKHQRESQNSMPLQIIDEIQRKDSANSHEDNQIWLESTSNTCLMTAKTSQNIGFFASSKENTVNGTRGFEHCLYVTPPKTKQKHNQNLTNSSNSSLDIESIVKKFRLMYGTTEKKQDQNEETDNKEEDNCIHSQSLHCYDFSDTLFEDLQWQSIEPTITDGRTSEILSKY